MFVFVSGGKWTTYRSMAEETLDAAVESLALPAGPCKTVGLMLDGAKGWTPTFYIRLVQDYGLEKEVRTGKVVISELILPPAATSRV